MSKLKQKPMKPIMSMPKVMSKFTGKSMNMSKAMSNVMNKLMK